MGYTIHKHYQRKPEKQEVKLRVFVKLKYNETSSAI